tara:strand:- start:1117 stop:1389 length:273 start_codon:yes stop_codon:yes gene_type:complete
MKKITMSVAALMLAMSVNSAEPSNDELLKEISMTTEDIIKSMRIINNNDSTITKEVSEIYIHNLLDVLSKLEDLQEKIYRVDSENCDEIN